MKLETTAGESFFEVAKNAKILANEHNEVVNFDFNGINCAVARHTDLDLLYKYYSDAHVMEWIAVGPDCSADYGLEVERELKLRRDANDKKRAAEKEEMYRKDKEQRELFSSKTKNVEIELIDVDGFEKAKAKNVDPYGACIFEYATGWAKLMQVEISNGAQLKDIASETSFQLGFLGISGFMYGAAVNVLSHYWKHGEELKNWHNGKYNHNAPGIVNPALLTAK